MQHIYMSPMHRCLASVKAGDPKSDGLAEPISSIVTFVSSGLVLAKCIEIYNHRH